MWFESVSETFLFIHFKSHTLYLIFIIISLSLLGSLSVPHLERKMQLEQWAGAFSKRDVNRKSKSMYTQL